MDPGQALQLLDAQVHRRLRRTPRSQLGKVMRRSVREQLDDLELQAGQWRKKLSETGDELRERASEFRHRMDSSREKPAGNANAPQSDQSARDQSASSDDTSDK